MHRFATTTLVSALLLAGLGAQAGEPVVVEGVKGDALDNVVAFLGYADETCESPEWRLRALYAQSGKRIRQALEVFGYYDPLISRQIATQDDCLTATYQIDPGKPVRYRDVKVSVTGAGAAAMHWQATLDANPLVPGGILNHNEYETYRRRLEDVARRFGYFDGVFLARRIEVHPEDYAADVVLEFATGERYRFGNLLLEQDVVTEDLLTRYTEFARDDPFDSDLIADVYEALLVTGYFANVDVRAAPRTDDTQRVDVTITATAAAPQTWTTGLGYGTDTGPKVRLGYFNRRRNQEGHQWSFTTSLSPVIGEAGLSYRIPLEKPRAEWLYFDAGFKDEDTDAISSQIAKVGVKRLQQRRNNWLETQFLEISNEDFRLADSAGTVFLVVPGIGWNRIETDDLARPKKGYRINFQVSGTSDFIGSDVSVLQFKASGKIIRTLPGNIRMLARAELATTFLDEVEELPASLRYFAGGDFSVRGYDYKTLGPVGSNGEVIGGENLLTGSVELDRPVRGDWAVATFVDAGNAFNEFSNIDLQVSVGAGVRWFSPVGPIRFDLAFPLSDQTEDDFRIHISLSPDL